MWPDWAVFILLGNIFFYKSSPNICGLLGYFEKHDFLNKNISGYILGNLGGGETWLLLSLTSGHTGRNGKISFYVLAPTRNGAWPRPERLSTCHSAWPWTRYRRWQRRRRSWARSRFLSSFDLAERLAYRSVAVTVWPDDYLTFYIWAFTATKIAH